jgi:hypothetical protein
MGREDNVIDTGCPMHISKISKLASSQDAGIMLNSCSMIPRMLLE